MNKVKEVKPVFMKLTFRDPDLRQRFKMACVGSNVTMNDEVIALIEWATTHWKENGSLPVLPEGDDDSET